MLNLVNITQARNNLSKIVDQVVEDKNPVILIRESKPQAVLISYEQFRRQEERWKDEFVIAMQSAKKQFKKYLKKKNIPYPKTEEEMYELINKSTGRT